MVEECPRFKVCWRNKRREAVSQAEFDIASPRRHCICCIAVHMHAGAHDTARPHYRSDSNPDLRLDPLMIETLQVLSRGNRRTSQLVRLRGLPRFLQLVWHQSLSAAVLRLLCQITASGDHDDVEACVAGMCLRSSNVYSCDQWVL